MQKHFFRHYLKITQAELSVVDAIICMGSFPHLWLNKGNNSNIYCRMCSLCGYWVTSFPSCCVSYSDCLSIGGRIAYDAFFLLNWKVLMSHCATAHPVEVNLDFETWNSWWGLKYAAACTNIIRHSTERSMCFLCSSRNASFDGNLLNFRSWSSVSLNLAFWPFPSCLSVCVNN